jgi:hypothetical protein
MKRHSPIPGLLTILAAASLFGGAAATSGAQLGYFGRVSPVGPILRPLGPQYPTSLTGYPTPFFIVNQNGMQGGYLGPNGPMGPAVSQFSGPSGATGSAGLYTPLSPTGTFGDPSMVQTYNPSAPNQPGPAFTGAIPRTSDTIEARIDSENRLAISWAGDPAAVASIRFALLDKDRKSIKVQNVTKLPAQARFAITSKTSYYQVYVEYVNGTVTNVISPL